MSLSLCLSRSVLILLIFLFICGLSRSQESPNPSQPGVTYVKVKTFLLQEKGAEINKKGKITFRDEDGKQDTFDLKDDEYIIKPGKYMIIVSSDGDFFTYWMSREEARGFQAERHYCLEKVTLYKSIRWHRVILALMIPLSLIGAASFYLGKKHVEKKVEEARVAAVRKDSPLPATMIDGIPQQIERFTVIEKVGQGGMATVYKVKDEYDDYYALKVPHAHIFNVSEFKGRFIREAKIVQTLHHPNIVRMHDYSLEEDGQIPYICLEFVEGESLKSFIDRNPILPVKRAVKIAIDIATALGYAHSKGVVHRDVKPENVMLTRKNEVKLMDLGIARCAESKTITLTGTTLGTPHYIAPEQIESKTVDGRADLYSLGIILYQMLTSHLPFEGEDPIKIIVKHVSEAPPAPSTHNALLPKDLEQIIMKLLEKNPGARYKSASELINALKRFL